MSHKIILTEEQINDIKELSKNLNKKADFSKNKYINN